MNVDCYSTLNSTYGLLDAAPLYNALDRTKLGGCFCDPTRPEFARGLGCKSGNLPVTEDLCTRFIGTRAFADVPEDTVA